MNPVTIGRDPESGIVVSEAFPRVSNNHATIELVDGRLVFTDHSSNGTQINGNLIKHEQVTLTNGDQILLAGDYLLAWPVLLNYFPDLQRRTLRFDANGVNAAAEMAQMQQNYQPQQNGGFAASANPAAGYPHAGGQTEQWRPGQQIPGAPGQGTEREPWGGGTQREVNIGGGTRHEGYTPGRGSSSEAGQLNSLTQSEIDEQLRRFNIGAFLGTWAWGLANRIYWPLAIIPLSLIPYIGQILSILLCTYLGLNGNPLGWQHSKGVSFPTWSKKQSTWIYIGAVVFIICAAAQLFAFYRIMNYV